MLENIIDNLKLKIYDLAVLGKWINNMRGRQNADGDLRTYYFNMRGRMVFLADRNAYATLVLAGTKTSAAYRRGVRPVRKSGRQKKSANLAAVQRLRWFLMISVIMFEPIIAYPSNVRTPSFSPIPFIADQILVGRTFSRNSCPL